jgi:hypothetical protein
MDMSMEGVVEEGAHDIFEDSVCLEGTRKTPHKLVIKTGPWAKICTKDRGNIQEQSQLSYKFV